jgi:O-antigen ligase
MTWHFTWGLFVFFIWLFLLFVLGMRFSTLLSTDEMSFTRRIDLFQSAFTLLSHSPLWGVGFGNFLVAQSLFHSLTSRDIFSFLQPVHSIFLLLLSETGVVGLLFFLYFLLIIVKQRILPLRHKKTLVEVYWLKLCLVILLVSIGCIDHYFLTLQQGQLLFAVIIGILISKPRSLPL